MSNHHVNKSRKTGRLQNTSNNNTQFTTSSVQYYHSAQQPYYPESAIGEPFSYMMPYGAYQHPQHNDIMPHQMAQSASLHDRGITNVSQNTHVYNTPPSKRLRTALRPQSATDSNDTNARKNSSRTPRTTPSKTAQGRKTFSDFRIASVAIGDWMSIEHKIEGEIRDSRIRFCFRNSGDTEVDSTLSATEAALVTPDRVSLSVSHGTERIIIPANHIKQIDFNRSLGHIRINTDGWAAFETAVETPGDQITMSDSPKHDRLQGHPILQWQLTEKDLTGGELAKAKTIEVKLDQQRPLTEPKWTRGSLTDHIDVNSRFLRIMNIVDAENADTFSGFLELWAGTDQEKIQFCELQLNSKRLLRILTGLMSSSNVLTSSIRFLLDGMLAIIRCSNISESDLCTLLRDAIFMIPTHMLTKSIDSIYEEVSIVQATQSLGLIGTSQDGIIGGAKRQRGESEVPSDQLARATLDEKRRRLSESEPQVLNQMRESVKIKSQSTSRSRTRVAIIHDSPRSAQMKISKSHESALPAKILDHPRSKSANDSPEDGARMSREEMLRTLEDCEGLSSSELEDEEESPLEAGTLQEQELAVEDWPPLAQKTGSFEHHKSAPL